MQSADVARVRAKFKVTKTEQTESSGQLLTTVHLSPVISGSPENEKFYKYTPAGGMTLGTVNIEAAKHFVPGREFYVDFTPAEQQSK